MRYGTTKDQRLTELIILSTAREIDHQYEWSAHEPLLRPQALSRKLSTLSNIGEIWRSCPLHLWGQRLLVQFTRELVSDEKVSSETYMQTIERFGSEGLMDIVGLNYSLQP